MLNRKRRAFVKALAFAPAGAVGMSYAAEDATEHSGQRLLLKASQTYFIRTDGSDANDGLEDTPSHAFATLQGAWDRVANSVDLGGQRVVFQLGSGVFTNGVRDAGSPLVGGKALIIGSGSDRTEIASAGQDCIEISQSEVTISAFRMSNTNGSGIHTYRSGVVTLGPDIDFAECSEAHHFCDNQGQIVATDGYSISGGAPIHFLAHTQGFIAAGGRTITLIGEPHFSTAFAYATRGGNLEAAQMTFEGTATGRRFYVDAGGVLWTNQKDRDYFPGSEPGTQLNGDLDGRSDFEWTPTVVGLSGAGEGTYTAQVGLGSRRGRLVVLEGIVSWSGHSGNGQLAIAGFPFPAANAASTCTPFVSGVPLDNRRAALGLMSGRHLQLYQQPAGGADAPSSLPMSGTGEVRFSIQYLAAA